MANIKKLQCKTLLVCTFIIFQITTNKAQTWDWAKSGDGTGESLSNATCIDSDGNVYITGIFGGQNITFGSYTLTNTGGYNIFLAKYDAQGNVLWAKNGHSTNSSGKGVSVDASGNVYITGPFYGNNIVFDSDTVSNIYNSSIFVTKYDQNGNVIWVKIAGGSTGDVGNVSNSIKVDVNGNVFITGYFGSPVMAFDTHSITLNYGNASDEMFLAKYDTNGNVIWTKATSGIGDEAYSVTTDLNGNAYVTGTFLGQSISFGTYTLTNATGITNVFLVKYDQNGNVMWAQKSLGSQDDISFSVAVDANFNSYIAGYFTSSTISFGSFTLTNQMPTGFLAKYDINGNVLWAKNTSGYSLALDANSIYLSGGYDTTISFGSYTLTNAAGNHDAMFVMQYDMNGNAIYATDLTHGGSVESFICVDENCNVYITGSFKGNPSIFSVGTTTLSQTGIQNVFTAKLTLTCQTQGFNELSDPNYEIPVFPNPNNGVFKIKIDPEIKDGELIIIDQLGQKAYNQKIEQGDNTIISTGLAVGLYHYIILQNKQQVGNGKLIIEKN